MTPERRTPIRREPWPPEQPAQTTDEEPPRDEDHLNLDRPLVKIESESTHK